LIFTVVMFQGQNRETIKQHLKICCVVQNHYGDERDKTVFHNTTPLHQTCKTKTKTDFLVSDRSCPKTDGLRPHHRLSAPHNTAYLIWSDLVSDLNKN